MKANLLKKVIEMSKSEAKRAGIPNSEEFKMLKELRIEFPTFEITVQKTKARDTMGGLTEDYMRRYIQKHDNDEGSIMSEFKTLCGEDGDFAKKASYGELKQWFLSHFPNVEEMFKKKDRIMEEAKARRAEQTKRVA